MRLRSLTKRAALATDKLLILVLAVFVIIAVLMFAFRVDINNFIRNLPGYSLPENDLIEIVFLSFTFTGLDGMDYSCNYSERISLGETYKDAGLPEEKEDFEYFRNDECETPRPTIVGSDGKEVYYYSTTSQEWTKLKSAKKIVLDEEIRGSCSKGAVGQIMAPERNGVKKRQFIYINGKKTNLYWKAEKGEIWVWKKNRVDKEVGEIMGGIVSLHPELLINLEEGRKFFNYNSDKYKEIESYIDVSNLVKLHNSYYGENNIICIGTGDEVTIDIADFIRFKFKEEVYLADLEEFFFVVGCEEFDSGNSAHVDALNNLNQVTGIEILNPTNSEQFNVLKEIYLAYEGEVNDVITWEDVSINNNGIDCKPIKSEFKNLNYYYYVQTEDYYYIYKNPGDALNDYIDKLSYFDDFKITWEYISGIEGRNLVVPVHTYNCVADGCTQLTGKSKEIKSLDQTDYGLYYIDTDDYYNIYLSEKNEIKNYDARISEKHFEELDSSGITWDYINSEILEQFFVNGKIVERAYESEGKYCLRIGVIGEIENICSYESRDARVIWGKN